MKVNNSPDHSNQQNKLIAYLDQFGKHLINRKNSKSLEQQLSSLSKAYNQSQQKILQIEKTLNCQSYMLEKQRSIIEIYKRILRNDMEDDCILQFVQQLEQNQEKQYIYEELQNVRIILSEKKRKNYQKQCQQNHTIKSLKLEVSKLHQQKSYFSDQSVEISQQNQELKCQTQTMNKEIRQLKSQLQTLTASLEKTSKQLYLQKVQNQELNRKLNIMNDQQKHLRQKQEQLSTLHRIIASSLNLNSNKQNISSNLLTKDHLFQIESKLGNLLKYKTQYKKLKQNNQQHQFLKQQLSLLKLFLNEQTLQLVKQYEQQKLECIENQIRNLAVFERNKVIRLEQCQRQVWKYKLQLLKQEQSAQLASTSRQTTSECQEMTTKISATMVDSLPPVFNSNVSQFMTQH